MQFHPEITQEMIERWTSFVAEHKAYVFERPNVQQPPEHFAGWEKRAEAVRAWRDGFLDDWLAA